MSPTAKTPEIFQKCERHFDPPGFSALPPSIHHERRFISVHLTCSVHVYVNECWFSGSTDGWGSDGCLHLSPQKGPRVSCDSPFTSNQNCCTTPPTCSEVNKSDSPGTTGTSQHRTAPESCLCRRRRVRRRPRLKHFVRQHQLEV